MPTMEGYEYADRSHEKTIQRSDFRYESCHNKPRPKSATLLFQNGWTKDGRRKMMKHTTEFVVQGCTHLKRREDSGCVGCMHRDAPGAGEMPT